MGLFNCYHKHHRNKNYHKSNYRDYTDNHFYDVELKLFCTITVVNNLIKSSPELDSINPFFLLALS
jgi:hypothetical protein